jgi:hypothetical protein
VLPDHVHVIDVTDQRRIAFIAQASQLGPGAPSQRDELLGRRLSNGYTFDRGQLRRALVGLRNEGADGARDRRNGNTAVSICISGRKAPFPSAAGGRHTAYFASAAVTLGITGSSSRFCRRRRSGAPGSHTRA